MRAYGIRRALRRRSSPRAPSGACRRLFVEPLEVRAMLAIFVVDSTADFGHGTLRQAILDANAAQGPDAIQFAIPGSGVQRIAPLTPLPDITDTLSIAGTSQPGSALNTLDVGDNAVLTVELDGSNAGLGAVGLRFVGGSAGSSVSGLIINRFESGVEVNRADNVFVVGNFIGTDAVAAAALGNRSFGVHVVSGSGTRIGGPIPQLRNIISGNLAAGIQIEAPATGIRIEGNLIGTNAAGNAALGNRNGITVLGTANVIDGTLEGPPSIIADVVVGGTFPGEGNLIAFNQEAGVAVGGDIRNVVVRGNSIHSNGGLGIDLSAMNQIITPGDSPFFLIGLTGQLASDGVTPNDDGDVDAGANTLQNFPVLNRAVSGPATRLAGTLSSTPDTSFTLDFYASSGADPSGHGEGQRYLGSAIVITDELGIAIFDATDLAASDLSEFFTATATGPSGTSEFSRFLAGEPRDPDLVPGFFFTIPAPGDPTTPAPTTSVGPAPISAAPTSVDPRVVPLALLSIVGLSLGDGGSGGDILNPNTALISTTNAGRSRDPIVADLMQTRGNLRSVDQIERLVFRLVDADEPHLVALDEGDEVVRAAKTKTVKSAVPPAQARPVTLAGPSRRAEDLSESGSWHLLSWVLVPAALSTGWLAWTKRKVIGGRIRQSYAQLRFW